MLTNNGIKILTNVRVTQKLKF